MISLTEDQREKVGEIIEKFKDHLKKELSEEEWKGKRKNKTLLFQELLGADNIDNLSEDGFRKIIENLWAYVWWAKKDYVANRILENNGLPKLRRELKDLLYGEGGIGERFGRFKRNIKGLGPSSITEILVFIFPDRYSLWNEKPKNVLPILGLKKLLPDRVFKYSISGEDYAKCNEVLGLVKEELEAHGFKDIDFLDVDIFMWTLYNKVVVKPRRRRRKEKPVPEEETIDVEKLGHWDTIGILLDLGNLLGYDTYVADRSKTSKVLGKGLGEIALLDRIPPFTYQRHLDTVKNVDVIWFREEFPAYCFEVEHTTGVTMGLLRLYQIRNFVNAKFYVVAPSDIIGRFQSEIEKDPFYRIKDRYVFKSYEELIQFYLEAKKYHKLGEVFLGSS